jgi:ABC-type polysaccharide/polyol phosphate export permease
VRLLSSGLPQNIPGRHFARHFVERRTLITQLVKRDFQQRYVGSAAGWLWGLVHPLVLLASYVFVFSIVLETKAGDTDVTRNYPMFLFAGMLPWLLFSETVMRSSGCLIEQANLITRTVFPAEIVPVSIFLSSLISHFLAVFLVIAGAAVFLRHFNPIVGMLPVFMLLVGMLAVGIGWIVSALQVYLRDTAQVLTVVMTLWFWATPILLPEDKLQSKIGKWAVLLLGANPLAYVVRGYRELLLGHTIPLADVVSTAGFAVSAFVVGGLIFRYLKRGFADVL